MRYPLQPLLDAAGLSLAGLNARIRMGGDTYRRIQAEGLSELMADRWSVRLGMHPAEVWSSWVADALDDPERCERQARIRTRDAAKKRRRYATDPEYRARKRAAQRSAA